MGSARQPETVDATFYAQVDPKWRDWVSDTNGVPILDSARVVTLTQQRPKRARGGAVIVKLTLRLPASAFLPLAPEAIVVVPASLTEPVVVEVLDANPEETA